ENTLSSGQSLGTMTCIASGGATCPGDTGHSITIQSLPKGGSLTYSLTTQLSMDVLVSVSDTVRATSLGDPNVADNLTTASATTRIPTSASSPTFTMLQSDVADYIGAEQSYSYTRTNAAFEVYATGGTLRVKVTGDQDWDATFYMPANKTQVETGSY